MPIVDLSEQRRLTRDFKIRLGEPMRNRTFPKEVDYFVLDDAPKDVKELYREKPKSLRVMLPFEWNAQVPTTQEDLVYSLYNRAYGQSKGLKCRGTGRSAAFPGVARTSDVEWAKRIVKATGQESMPQKMPNGDTHYNVKCLGHDCPYFMLKVRVPDPNDPSKEIDAPAEGHEKNASCNDVAIFRFFLLHPSLDPNDKEHYCVKLGTAEIATGSINSIIDIQSGFATIQAFTGGRSAGIPMTLYRKPTTTFRPVRQTHYTCAISFDQREIQRWAAIPMNEVFLDEPQREQLKRLQAAPLGMTVDSVRDLIPRALPDAVVQNGAAEASETAQAAPDAAPRPDAPDPAAEAPTASGESPEDWHDAPRLVAAQLDELKTLAGGPEDATKPYDKFNNPWRKDALERLKGAVVAMKAELGIDEQISFSDLRVPHYHWLKKRLPELPPL